jgi:hypothetical protein
LREKYSWLMVDKPSEQGDKWENPKNWLSKSALTGAMCKNGDKNGQLEFRFCIARCDICS